MSNVEDLKLSIALVDAAKKVNVTFKQASALIDALIEAGVATQVVRNRFFAIMRKKARETR